MQAEFLNLPSQSLGTERTLTVYRFGDAEARPRVYVQAGLHADELAAPLAAHHLVCLLNCASHRGDITGRVTVVPMANPIGAAQFLLTKHMGRYDLAMGGNFNRGFADVSEAVCDAVADKLGGSPADNHAVVADTISNLLAARQARSEHE